VAGEAGVPFFSVAGAEFVESLVGVGAARIRDLFRRVNAVAPAIVFIDELDAAARRRGSGGSGGGSDEREHTLNQLLIEIDGFEVAAGLVVMGATNRPDILDPAVLRPGRFDRHVTVDQPDHDGRKRILQLHARGKPLGSDVDFDELARRTPGFTGADLASVINEAALLTVREQRDTVGGDLLDEAVQRVLHGPRRRGRVLSDAERHRAAVHESGHAVVAAAMGMREEIHRVSILARGRSLGLTSVRLESDAVLHTPSDLVAQLVVSFGGLAAEEVVLGESSTGAEQDIEHATHLARQLVGRYGMSERLGRVRLLASEADEFLGITAGLAAMSEHTHEEFDAEVRRLLDNAEESARTTVAEHRVVEALARGRAGGPAVAHCAPTPHRLEALAGGLVDDQGDPGPAAVDGTQAGGEPGQAPGCVGGAVDRVEHDDHVSVDLVGARLLAEHAQAGAPEHGQGGYVGHDVGPVLAGAGAGRSPVAQVVEGGPHGGGGLGEHRQEQVVGHPAGRYNRLAAAQCDTGAARTVREGGCRTNRWSERSAG